MSGLFQRLKQALGLAKAERVQLPPAKGFTHFAEGDRVLVDGLKLTAPLQRNSSSDYHNGRVLHNEVIGNPLSTLFIRTQKGGLYKLEPPSLEQYVTLTPRLVTPVYANYASTIVSLLDIHTKPWTEKTSNSAPSLQILEAGTGHGSLTLHVARAIAAANPPPLDAEVPPVRPTEVKRMASTPQAQPQDALAQAWTEWKQGRSAVLHTVEKVVANRYHAEKVVRGFRQGLYWPHVNFYAGDVKTWVQEQLEQRRGRNWSFSKAEPEFLDHVLLDMPGVHTQLKHVHAAMREGAKLVVFVPSITQIGECARVVQEGSLPLTMDKVVELGEGISNGRRWDVRMVMPRKRSDAAAESENEKSLPAGQDGDGTNVGPQDSEDAAPPSPSILDEAMAQDEPVMVCRPLVGERTFGGGFVALFRKVSPESAAMAAQWRRGQTGWARKRNRLSV